MDCVHADDDEWMEQSPDAESPGSESCEVQQDSHASGRFQDKVFTQWISRQEYVQQGNAYTKESVEALVRSPEYLQWHNVCSSCHANWYHDACSQDCRECDGFSMTRPCPICRGDVRCNALWERDVDMSHKFKEAHWSGQCRLPESEQRSLMLRYLVDADPDSIAEAFGDLGDS